MRCPWNPTTEQRRRSPAPRKPLGTNPLSSQGPEASFSGAQSAPRFSGREESAADASCLGFIDRSARRARVQRLGPRTSSRCRASERSTRWSATAGPWVDDRCSGRTVAGIRYRYRALKPHNEVIFWKVGSTDRSGKFDDCAIQDGRNWACKASSDAPRSITLVMSEAPPLPGPAGVTLPFRAVSNGAGCCSTVAFRATGRCRSPRPPRCPPVEAQRRTLRENAQQANGNDRYHPPNSRPRRCGGGR